MELVGFGNTDNEKLLVIAILIVSSSLGILVTMNIPSEVATIVSYVFLFFGVGVVIGALITFVCGLIINSKLFRVFEEEEKEE